MSIIEDTFLSIETVSEGIYKEKGSKFIARAYPVASEEDIKDILQALRKEFYDARHHCFAYILGHKADKWRASDDGEPNNSAGMPILNQIRSFQLTNILVVVIRYFGGTKLGVSGLINAYKIVTQETLQNATVIECIVRLPITFSFDYLSMNEVMALVKEYNLDIITQLFDNECFITLSVRQKNYEEVAHKLQKIKSVQIKVS